jgi:hypothetical protein
MLVHELLSWPMRDRRAMARGACPSGRPRGPAYQARRLARPAPGENRGPATPGSPTDQARGLTAHADAYDCIMVRVKRSYRIQILCRRGEKLW